MSWGSPSLSAGRPASGRFSPPFSPSPRRRRPPAKGAALLAAYSLGLGAPFFVAALAIEPFIRWIKRFKRHFGVLERAVGVLLVLTGIAFLTGSIQNVSFWLLQTFPGLAAIG